MLSLSHLHMNHLPPWRSTSTTTSTAKNPYSAEVSTFTKQLFDLCARSAPALGKKDHKESLALTPSQTPCLSGQNVKIQWVAATEAKMLPAAGDGHLWCFFIGIINFWMAAGTFLPLLLIECTTEPLQDCCHCGPRALAVSSALIVGTPLFSNTPDLRQLDIMAVLEMLFAFEALKISLPCWCMFSMSLLSPRFWAKFLINFLAALKGDATRCLSKSCWKERKMHLINGLSLQCITSKGLIWTPASADSSTSSRISQCLMAKSCACPAMAPDGESTW